MNNLAKRAIFGAIYVGLVVASILVHPIFFGCLFLGITMYAMYEYSNLVQVHPFYKVVSIFLGGVAFVGAGVFEFADQIPVNVLSGRLIEYVIAYVCVLVISMVASLAMKQDDPFHNWGNLLISQIIAWPFVLMNPILAQDKYLLLVLFITVWVNDTGAYCVGCLTAKRAKGNHKILKECTLPLTAAHEVDMIVTEMGVMMITPEGIELTEINPEFTVEQVQEATGAKLIISKNLKPMAI